MRVAVFFGPRDRPSRNVPNEATKTETNISKRSVPWNATRVIRKAVAPVEQ